MVGVQTEIGQKRKRKAKMETKTPRKKQRTDIDETGEANEVTVVDLTKTTDEELPVKQAPARKKRKKVRSKLSLEGGFEGRE